MIALAVNPVVLTDLRLLHPEAGSNALDLAIERALQDDPSFERSRREQVRVHDWRQHVGAAVRAAWPNLPLPSRVAIALDAEDAAGQEEWD